MNCFNKYFVILVSLNFIEGSFRCDYKYSTDAQAWFKHNVNPAKWSDARLRCALEGATLASPITEEIANEMGQIILSFFSAESEIFTGVHATFSQGDYYSVEGVPLSEIALPWAENEPDNKGNNESCITFNANGEMSDHSCEETRPYICYRAGDTETKLNECGAIDPEYRLDARTKRCYKFHTVPRNYSRAFFTCSAEGGHLAIINSEVEAKVLKELFKKYPAGKMEGKFWKDVAFVGSYDWGEPMDWRTIHGQSLWEAGYNKFKVGEPNNASPGENCVAIYRNGQSNDLWCNRPAAFICEKSPDFLAVCKASTKDLADTEQHEKTAAQEETVNPEDKSKETVTPNQGKSVNEEYTSKEAITPKQGETVNEEYTSKEAIPPKQGETAKEEYTSKEAITPKQGETVNEEYTSKEAIPPKQGETAKEEYTSKEALVAEQAKIGKTAVQAE